MDLLRAINLILPALGEHPVTSVDAKHPTVAIILQNIQSQIDETLVEHGGWWFNAYDNKLYPGPEGEVALPLNTLSILPKDPMCGGVQRRGRLYNTSNRTFKWPVGTAIPVRIVERLEFEDLPESVAQFILYTAMVKCYITDIGLEQIVQEWKGLAGFARNSMESEHLRNARYSTAQSRRFRRIRNAINGR